MRGSYCDVLLPFLFALMMTFYLICFIMMTFYLIWFDTLLLLSPSFEINQAARPTSC